MEIYKLYMCISYNSLKESTAYTTLNFIYTNEIHGVFFSFSLYKPLKVGGRGSETTWWCDSHRISLPSTLDKYTQPMTEWNHFDKNQDLNVRKGSRTAVLSPSSSHKSPEFLDVAQVHPLIGINSFTGPYSLVTSQTNYQFKQMPTIHCALFNPIKIHAMTMSAFVHVQWLNHFSIYSFV